MCGIVDGHDIKLFLHPWCGWQTTPDSRSSASVMWKDLRFKKSSICDVDRWRTHLKAWVGGSPHLEHFLLHKIILCLHICAQMNPKWSKIDQNWKTAKSCVPASQLLVKKQWFWLIFNVFSVFFKFLWTVILIGIFRNFSYFGRNYERLFWSKCSKIT